MSSSRATSLKERLDQIRRLSAQGIEELAGVVLPQDRLPVAYLEGLSLESRVVLLRASLLLWAVTGGHQVPRELQLQATLAAYLGLDSLVCLGTGQGKTLSIALNALLQDPSDNSVTVIISPLKRLQITQATEFYERYSICTVAINEETPHDEDFWHNNIYNLGKRSLGTARIIIVTVEQLFKDSAGHMPRMGNLVRDRNFQKYLKRIYVDEAHFIRTAGIALNGLKAFRPGWGKLDELKALLPSRIPWQAMSATFPPHILTTVVSKILRQNYITIKGTSNRPNTAYATHAVIDKLEELRNYDCFLNTPFDITTQPRILLFFDDLHLASNVAEYLDGQLPVDLQDTGIVSHYYSVMSDQYLNKIHGAFVEKGGRCRIMCSTAGQSVGVDFPDVDIVCTVGLPSDIVDALQRGGRVGRREGAKGLFLIFYEPWALEISHEEFSAGDLNDQDRPRGVLKPNAQKSERAAYSSIQLVQHSTCLRRFFADYLNDKSITALTHSGYFCCNQGDCIQEGFLLSSFLPSPLFLGSVATVTVEKRKATYKKYRTKKDRLSLDGRLMEWLQKASVNDPLRGFRTMYDILSLRHRQTLIRALPHSLTSTTSIKTLLNETGEWEQEWASNILEIISQYDRELGAIEIKRKAEQLEKREEAKTKKREDLQKAKAKAKEAQKTQEIPVEESRNAGERSSARLAKKRRVNKD